MTLTPQFDIIKAVTSAYRFVFAHKNLLLKLALIPIFAHFVCTGFVTFMRADASPFEQFLWMIPAHITSAWYAFLLIRMLAFGETTQSNFTNADEALRFQTALRLSIITSLLISMVITCLWSLRLLVKDGAEPTAMQGYVAIFIMVFVLWAVRYTLLPIVAALGASLTQFVKHAKGFMLSIHVISTSAIASFPVFVIYILFTFALLSLPAFKDISADEAALQQNHLFLLIQNAVTGVMNIAISTFTTSALTFGLLDMMKGKRT
jgi:hypothetical protein